MSFWKNKNLLILEDSPLEKSLYTKYCESLGFNVTAYGHPKDVVEHIFQEAPQFIISDIYFKNEKRETVPLGLEFIKNISQESPNSTILALSSHPQVHLYNECLNAGAHHFARKPLQTKEELELAITIALKNRTQRQALGKSDFPNSDWTSRYPDGFVLPNGVRHTLSIASKNPTLPFVLIGETGTGKEAVVNALHNLRKAQSQSQIPLVIVNCTAIPKDLAESILFGHKKGAFSGAIDNSLGYIGAADQGILFLDEIHTLDLSLQQKFLRVLQDGQYSRVGDIKKHTSQFQVVVASTKDLDTLVEKGQFLLDLRSRLTGLEVHLKPLRQRKEDFPDLIGLHLAKQGIKIDQDTFQALVEKCQRYYWQGNIRQLFMALNVMLAHSAGQEVALNVDFLPLYKSMKPPVNLSNREENPNDAHLQEFSFKSEWILEGKSLKEIIESVEKEVLFRSFQKHKGNASKVCRELDIPRSTFDNKKKKYSINL